MYIISGGSSGLGLEIAGGLVAKGECVLITGRKAQRLEEARQTLLQRHPEACVLTYPMNAAHEADVDALVERLNREELQLKGLVNAAGTTFFGPLESVTRRDIDAALESNLIGLMLMTSKIATHMIEKPVSRQRIVSILSTAALKGKKHETLYNAAKWGARGFLESVRDELDKTPIEVINIFPGGMKTAFWEGTTSGYAVDGFMDPADVAKLIVEVLLSDQVFVTDMTIGRPKK